VILTLKTAPFLFLNNAKETQNMCFKLRAVIQEQIVNLSARPHCLVDTDAKEDAESVQRKVTCNALSCADALSHVDIPVLANAESCVHPVKSDAHNPAAMGPVESDVGSRATGAANLVTGNVLTSSADRNAGSHAHESLATLPVQSIFNVDIDVLGCVENSALASANRATRVFTNL
jgi:hypothetical protein